jgi:ribosomal protein L35
MKAKTRKSLSSRFKITSTGKVMRRVTGQITYGKTKPRGSSNLKTAGLRSLSLWRKRLKN